jgi:transposase
MPKVSGTKNIAPNLRALVYQKTQENISVPEIANFTGIPRSTIYRILKNRNERGHHNDAPKSGRPLKIDDRSLRHLKISLEQDRRQSLADITNTVNDTVISPVHCRTVRRAVQDRLGMSAHIAAKKPYLKPAHRKARHIWAKRYRGWEEEDWKHVIWTDEASVEMGKNTRVVWVWRRPGERYDEKCTTPTFKSGRDSLMIWGCMAYGRLGPLIRIPKDEKTGADYVRLVLGGPLLDIYMDLSEERGIVAVVEDGAPIHRCKAAKNFRTSHLMEVFPHPAQSPDLNPLEHVWRILKTRVNQRKDVPKTVDELWKVLQEEWAKIDIELVNQLARSMPHRVEAVYNVKGGPTKY